MQHRGGRVVIAAALLVMGAGIAFWIFTAPREAPTSAAFNFDDWIVRCRTVDDESGCSMAQQVMDRRSREAILQLRLGRAVEADGLRFVVVTPLGVAVAPGAEIQIGEFKRSVAFTQCLPAGCIASVAANDELLAAMTSSASAQIAVVNRVGARVAVPFSLKGFAPAFAKMKEQSGDGENGATWWTHVWNSSRTNTKPATDDKNLRFR